MNSTQPLFDEETLPATPVYCLGREFPSESARREHYLQLLLEKLNEPSFRRTSGFPLGTDKDILNLSDPPYFTACPNPFLAEFIDYYGKNYSPEEKYAKEPFAADVSEGKYDPLYKLHPYHTKVPHRAIMRYILQYTEPGDLIQDSFAGTGATAVAAQLCGNRGVVESLGYRVAEDGVVFREELSAEEKRWVPFSKLGCRLAVVSDLSPAAAFISYIYNTPVDILFFQRKAKRILNESRQANNWMYQTLHNPDEGQLHRALKVVDESEAPALAPIGPTGNVNFTVWSDVFTCPECAGDIVFWDSAVDRAGGKVKETFGCPTCGAQLTKKKLDRKWRKVFDPYLGEVVNQAIQIPVLINYKVGKSRHEKVPDAVDRALISKTELVKGQAWCPTYRLPQGFNTRQPIESHGLTHVHHFYSGRNRISLADFNSRCDSPLLKSLISTVAFRITKRYGLTYQSGSWGAGGGPTNGTLYIPSLVKELNIYEMLDNAIAKSESKSDLTGRCALIATQAAQGLELPPNSIDYAFIDPPFGSNIMYSELNFLWESWLGVLTETKFESIESKAQSKSLDDYRNLMTGGLKKVFDALKPGRWVTVEFSNTQASVWNAIQTSLQEAGFVVANVAALDKQKGSFKAITTTTAVKQDLVISAYKPNGGLEERFLQSAGNEESAWDFVRTHLKYLASVKLKEGQLEFIAERDPRVIFDRMIAYFVRHNFAVPFSSQEFQAGLSQRFAERDGMVFLPEQVTEYDRHRIQAAAAPQMEFFISDERSAIDWLTDFLRRKPSTYQELHPEFIQQLGAGWKKHEAKPELSALLEDSFLRYDPKAKDGQDVPSQIHSYLSSNWAVLRNLDKNDPRLKAAATDRWFVPDPTKAQELEKVRDKSLLKEFETYKAHTGRKLKEFRLEVMRTGFKTCWGNRDYATIIAVAKKVPDDVLQQDEKLLLWYDQALTRMEEA